MTKQIAAQHILKDKYSKTHERNLNLICQWIGTWIFHLEENIIVRQAK